MEAASSGVVSAIRSVDPFAIGNPRLIPHTPDIDAIERALDYRFNEHDLLCLALSHRSNMGLANNQRLEYLGDSIIGFFISQSLYRLFPQQNEGSLTAMRARLVRNTTLASLARELRLDRYLIMASGELKNNGRNRVSALADSFEALVGAIYLDGGIEPAEQFLAGMYATLLNNIRPGDLRDSKTRLQERLQKDNSLLPAYRVLRQDGEAHDLTFEVSCFVPGMKRAFIARGRSRKAAEQAAAEQVLTALDKQGGG